MDWGGWREVSSPWKSSSPPFEHNVVAILELFSFLFKKTLSRSTLVATNSFLKENQAGHFGGRWRPVAMERGRSILLQGVVSIFSPSTIHSAVPKSLSEGPDGRMEACSAPCEGRPARAWCVPLQRGPGVREPPRGGVVRPGLASGPSEVRVRRPPGRRAGPSRRVGAPRPQDARGPERPPGPRATEEEAAGAPHGQPDLPAPAAAPDRGRHPAGHGEREAGGRAGFHVSEPAHRQGEPPPPPPVRSRPPGRARCPRPRRPALAPRLEPQRRDGSRRSAPTPGPLCGPGQVASPLCASVSSSSKWDDNSVHLRERLGRFSRGAGPPAQPLTPSEPTMLAPAVHPGACR